MLNTMISSLGWLRILEHKYYFCSRKFHSTIRKQWVGSNKSNIHISINYLFSPKNSQEAHSMKNKMKVQVWELSLTVISAKKQVFSAKNNINHPFITINIYFQLLPLYSSRKQNIQSFLNNHRHQHIYAYLCLKSWYISKQILHIIFLRFYFCWSYLRTFFLKKPHIHTSVYWD